MLHRCSQCHALYLTSHYLGMCDYCGSEERERLESREVDKDVEWHVHMIRIAHGEPIEVERRWRIG